jgi:purine-cytosine permease-like protein
MTYTPPMGTSTSAAGFAHLAALTGPVVPLLIYAFLRRRDSFVATEAAKATNFSAMMVTILVFATFFRIYVPLVGFLGTLAQWVVPVVAIYFSLAGFWLARQGNPAHYPYQLEVVKTDE